MATRFLHLICHSDYVDDMDNPDYGNLSANGRRQAELTARALRHRRIRLLMHCTTAQSVQMVQVMRPYFPTATLKPAPELWEHLPAAPLVPLGKADMTILEMLTELTQLQTALEPIIQEYLTPARGEDRHEMLIGHNNGIRYFVCRALDLPLDNMLRFQVQPGSMTRIVIEPDGQGAKIGLAALNSVSHLPPELRGAAY